MEKRSPTDAQLFNGKYYKLFDRQLSWHKAREYCRDLGGHLIIVKSDAENQFISNLLAEKAIESCWLGATDEHEEGKWGWEDGSPMLYTNWSKIGKQPNNKQGIEHYAVLIVADQSRWSDQPNQPVETHPRFICQWD